MTKIPGSGVTVPFPYLTNKIQFSDDIVSIYILALKFEYTYRRLIVNLMEDL